MKKFLLVLLIAVYSFSLELEQAFLEPNEAFKPTFTKQNDKVVFKLKLGKDIYLYDEKIKVLITKPSKIDLTNEVVIPEPIPYEEWIVQFDDLNIEIPFSLLKSKVDSSSYELQIKFQGCSKKGLCYAPMKENFKLDFSGSNVNVIESKATNTVSNTNEVDTKVEENETDLIASTLKNGNVLLILGTFFGFGFITIFNTLYIPNDSYSFFYYCKSW